MRSIMISEEDLAAIREADAEIEAGFRLTPENIALSRYLDRVAAMEKLDNRERRIAEYNRAYREANRERIAESKRAYREANRERIEEHQRAYREANRERIAEYNRAYREANRERIAEYNRAYYEANRERITESQRAAIVDFRRSYGLTQRDFAKSIGVSTALVSNWECGRSPINLDKVGAVFPMLAEALR